MNDLARVFKALSDETRLNILVLVSTRNICQKGISKYLGISDSAVSQHIKVLKEANIITGCKEGYYVLYQINENAFEKCVGFINSVNSQTSQELLDIRRITANNISCNLGCKSIKKCCRRREK
ncbi:ArsR family transcriptional regulator [Romboutsia weinsteinii]|uniref:ArsR family transcriptional regulator n=1 Tax=Romboutsia weinsteinii TaxID=2020949 RepID=A0A371J8F6_9FIRM|nr:metalloregulator ArsR/SmtB family transcription factor [Romboutsia weinsteinii]RDY29024.1 ArsR family transcriptional regulator [Romboutsia weinsteinii]